MPFNGGTIKRLKLNTLGVSKSKERPGTAVLTKKPEIEKVASGPDIKKDTIPFQIAPTEMKKVGKLKIKLSGMKRVTKPME